MPSPKPISLPAGFAPAFAIGFSDQSGELTIVENGKPLPVTFPTGTPIAVQPVEPEIPAPLEGAASSSQLAGPFLPAAGKPVVLTLSGVWDGTVQVERSADSGASRHGLTAGGAPWGRFTGNACEIVWAEEESGAELYLDIELVSGTLAYRIAQ